MITPASSHQFILSNFSIHSIDQLPGQTSRNRCGDLNSVRSGCKYLCSLPGTRFLSAHPDRLNHELELIIRKGFSSYLLILEDIFHFVKDEELWVGAGRGSGAGSLVLYVLGITTIDPIKYDLLFERFMSDVRSIDVVVDYFGEGA